MDIRPLALNCHRPNKVLRCRERGFALIATISVMVLLVLVALAMLSLSTIETRVSVSSAAKAEAQANARMALMVAIGELQKYTGADQRVTAESAILEKPDGISPIANRHWVGVWRSDALKGESSTNPQPVIFRNTAQTGVDAGSLIDRRADGEYDANDQALTWLVSHRHPGSTLPDPANSLPTDHSSVLLVGPGSSSGAFDEVRVQRVPVMHHGKEKGGYAWWIGDEGIKARFNLSDPSSGLAQRQPWLSATQSGIGIIAGYEKYEMAATDIEKTITRETVDLSGIAVSPVAARSARLKNFHDLTFSSLGLPTDTHRGGLRRDLSAFLVNGTASALGHRKGLDSSSPILDSPKLKDVSAKFGLLHHWNSVANAAGSSSGIDPVPPKNLTNGTVWGWTSPGNFGSGINLSLQDTAPVHPIMVDVGISYGVSFSKAGASSGGITPYRLNIHYYPRVVLWNPYNVKINAASYVVQINMPHKFEVQLRIPGLSPQAHVYFEPVHQRYGGENLPHRPHFSIPATSFAPGEALLFTADAGGASDGNNYWGNPDTATAGSLEHFSLSTSQPAPFNQNFYVRTQRVIQIPDSKISDTAYQVFARADGVWKLYFYKLYLNKGSGGNIDQVRSDPSTYPPLQYVTQSENGAYGSDGPWFSDIPASASTPLRELGKGPIMPFYRFKWGHRVQWLNDTDENQRVRPGTYNTPYLDYNTIANHNMRAGWHMRSPVEVAFRATSSGGRYVHGIMIDDPYGWDWQDPSLFPVPVGGKNRVSPFGRSADFGGQTFPFLDIPSNEAPLLSLGALQHAPMSQFAWHPLNAFANSLADPRVSRNRSTHFVSASEWSTIGISARNWGPVKQSHVNRDLEDASFLHDLSYESNFALWDSYFLSTVKSSHGLGDILDNPRMIIVNDGGKPAISDLQDFHKAAKHIMVKGAFNVNSTSEVAWVALFASLRSNPDMQITLQDGSSFNANDVYSRFLKPYKIKYSDAGPKDAATWMGYRQLTDSQMLNLAKEVVKEIKQRGPFLSLADFVNRRLVDPPKSSGSETEHSRTGLKGALQAAIDRTTINEKHLSSMKIDKVEYDMGGNAAKQVQYGISYPDLAIPVTNNHRAFGPKPDHNHWADSKLVGVPSYLTQADMLQKLGSVLSARSDTFVVRAYGESLDAKGAVRARAWCEATLQRTHTAIYPDDEGLDAHLDIAAHPQAAFGRRYKITSFRWLNKDEV